MNGPTHLLLGAAAAVPAAIVGGQPVLLVAGIVGGLWADLDLSETTLAHWRIPLSGGRGRRQVYIHPFAWLGALASVTGEHRGWWHSGAAVMIFSALAGWLLGWLAALAFFAGYVSHLLGDACTPSGIALWPGIRWHLLPFKWRVKTGSAVEHVISAVAAVIVLAYLLPALFTL